VNHAGVFNPSLDNRETESHDFRQLPDGLILQFRLLAQGTITFYERGNGFRRSHCGHDFEQIPAAVQPRRYGAGGLYRSRGIDTDLTWTPNSNLQMVFNYNHSLEANIVSDPSVNPNTPGTLDYQKKFLRPLSQAPENRFNLVSKYNFDSGSLKNVSVGAAVRYNSTYSITNAGTYDLWAPAETLFDFFVSYRTKLMGIPAELKFNMNNVTDERNDYTWGDGRTYFGTVKFSF
jgi:outer membrane receptor protein involved in Fe transport